ncbi:phage shock protein PspA [Alteromonas lipolytica]|uniref:Phage shock protein PspA n=1 Tax=Alteromonas lipolytica TaxID=1856405 RepID=A0A1E8FDJ2_9ALTE|nr:phage shock protein PspA [Alteromonas lipolytica]OFI33543.1 phage shock protein PspA [Alteromonas lipolytica]GGF58790.1 phage shock protein PspA [Alteromonas lipolytica]
MGMFTRINDIIQSNINALLDKAEDPEKMIRLIIQEMQETLVEIRTLAAKHIAEQKHLNRQIENLAKRAAHWQVNAELAVTKGKDDLARAALKEKKSIEAKQAELQEHLAVIDEALLKVQDDTARLNEKLNEAKAKQKALAIRRDSAVVRMQAKQATHSDKLESVMGRFDHYEQRVDELEARVEAYDLTDSATKSSLQAEFDALEKDDAIENELAALKAKQVA